MKKLTALQWLYSKLNQMPTRDEVCDLVYQLEEQAKAMEKEQIMDAVNDSWNMAKHSNFADAQAEHYYNETYGGDK
jgi:hypothetical protein